MESASSSDKTRSSRLYKKLAQQVYNNLDEQGCFDSVKEKITDPGALSVQFQKDSSADSVPINIDVDVEELRKCIENRIREAVIQFIHFINSLDSSSLRSSE